MSRNNPPEFLARTRNTASCIIAPRSGASAFKPSIDAIPLRVLGARHSDPVDGPGESTPGYVKLLLPPRQSRGNSHFGLAR